MALESRLPGLSAWIRVLDYRKSQLERLGNVEQAFDSELTADEIASYEFDHVALATGARWRADGVGRWHTSPIEIDAGMPVLTPDDLMAGRMPAGERVVLFDDDHYYMGGVLAELLAAAGHAVALVTPEARVSDWTQATMEQHRIQKAAARGRGHGDDDADAGVGRAGLGDGGLRLHRAGAAAALRRPRAGHVAAAERRRCWSRCAIAGVAVRAVGDALSPGTIAAAVWDGRRFAEELDDPAADDRDRPPFLREVVQLAPDEAAVASG